MKEKTNTRSILRYLSAAVLLAGIITAGLIYWTAPDTSEDGYEIVGGFIYQAGGVKSKSYTHDLQLYGGNAAVLADDFMHWFLGLWRGKSLAYTVAFIAAFISFVIFVIANNIRTASPPSKENDVQSG